MRRLFFLLLFVPGIVSAQTKLLSGTALALPVASGGTGAITAQGAMDALTVTAGSTNTYVWTTNGSHGSWTAPPSGTLSGLTINGVLYGTSTTTATSTAAGSNGQFLSPYPAGVPTWGNTLGTSLAANTSGDGLVLIDTTAATSGNQRYSPRLRLTGNAYANTAAMSEPADWIIENVPVQGNTIQTNLNFSYQENGGGYVKILELKAPASGGAGIVNVGGATATTTLEIGGGVIFTNSTTLGSGVTASSLTSVGTLTGLTMNKAAIATTYTEAPIFENATASTAAIPIQQSGSLELLAHVWDSTATAHDSTRAFDLTCVPISSANPLVSNLIIRAGNGGTNMQPEFKLSNSGDVSIYNHILTISTIGAATDDGTGVTSASVAGSDVAGTVTLTSALNAGGGYAQIAFGTTYGTAPTVVISPSDGTGVTAGSYYVTATATAFKINFPSTVVAASATFTYIVIH